MSHEREVLTYDTFGTATQELAQEIADSGRTLELVHAFCGGHVAEARTVVIYEKPQSVIKPDYSWRSTERWIDFPWSVLPPVVAGWA